VLVTFSFHLISFTFLQTILWFIIRLNQHSTVLLNQQHTLPLTLGSHAELPHTTMVLEKSWYCFHISGALVGLYGAAQFILPLSTLTLNITCKVPEDHETETWIVERKILLSAA
jgi:hypothetical protein